MIHDSAEQMKDSRIVHWNNGLWDLSDLFDDGELFSSKEEYVHNMLRIADQLLKKHEIVIFATTTPVNDRHSFIKNEDIVAYNQALIPHLVERGVFINDLHSLLVGDVDRYICDDLIHLSQEGIDLCARAVAEVIRAAAAQLN